ncbi:hypothetical protein KBC03_08400 [Patescibacteria group bacterium]|nr:hypothetical protein [Patescibacteria group bacterium]
MLLVLLIMSSCGKSEKKQKNTITQGGFTIELLKREGSVLQLKVTNNTGREFAFATSTQSQSKAQVSIGQLVFVESPAIISGVMAGNPIYFYEYQPTKEGFRSLKPTADIYYPASAFYE